MIGKATIGKRIMKKRIILIAILAFAVFACIAYLAKPHKEDAIVEGEIIDALSKDSVWHAWIVLDGKSILKFEGTHYRLTGMEPGMHTLTATAPDYEDFSKEVQVNAGVNRFDIRMNGIEVPDLSDIVAFTETSDKGIVVEVRLLDREKVAIEHHPAIPFEMEGELFLRPSDSAENKMGDRVFRGPIRTFWDPEEKLAKNKGIIPWDRVDVEPRENLNAVLRLNVHTAQGDFSYDVKDIELYPRAEQ